MDVLLKLRIHASEIARVPTDELGWNVITTYTLIKLLHEHRDVPEPGFMCHALVSKSAVQEAETDELINKNLRRFC